MCHSPSHPPDDEKNIRRVPTQSEGLVPCPFSHGKNMINIYCCCGKKWKANQCIKCIILLSLEKTNHKLVGGINPFETYARQIESFPQFRGGNETILKPSPGTATETKKLRPPSFFNSESIMQQLTEAVPTKRTCHEKCSKPLPIRSMYGIFTYIWLMFMANIGKYTIHGSYGLSSLSTIVFWFVHRDPCNNWLLILCPI